MKGIEQHVIEEGNLRASKCTGDFGGPNMWNLYVKNTDGFFQHCQWMSVNDIQSFFKTKLPVYLEHETSIKYKQV